MGLIKISLAFLDTKLHTIKSTFETLSEKLMNQTLQLSHYFVSLSNSKKRRKKKDQIPCLNDLYELLKLVRTIVLIRLESLTHSVDFPLLL